MEGSNLEHKSQLSKDTAILFRKGLNKEDLMK
jgi:hypothetical protein